MPHLAMSLEAVMDEERKEVMAMLTAAAAAEPPPKVQLSPPASTARSPSPPAPQRIPVRSMLDIGSPGHTVKQRSPINGSTSGTAQKTAHRTVTPIRSMLDIDSKPGPSVGASKSAQASPVEENRKASASSTGPHRSLSDAAGRPAGFGHRANALARPKGNDPSAYQFSGYLVNNPGGPVVPKRVTQAGKKSTTTSTIGEKVRGGDMGQFGPKGGHDNMRSRSIGSAGLGAKPKSKSPQNRLGIRSASPYGLAPAPDPSEYLLDDGSVLDMNNAYRRLSDANLARSGGSLAALAEKSQKRRANSRDQFGSSGVRLEKAPNSTGERSNPADSSDEDEGTSSDEGGRGRKKDETTSNRKAVKDDTENTLPGVGKSKEYRVPKSLLAAADEERHQVSSRQTGGYKVRSMLLDAEIKVPEHLVGRSRPKPSRVHPNTSFEYGTSGGHTPMESETEAVTDIKRAQKLSVHMTPVFSTPLTSRCVRTIFRGDFAKMQREAQDHQRHVRKYVVATDLSPEAQHALEWTVGTVLRDGDTLLAIYCIDEELAKASNDMTSATADGQQKHNIESAAASAKSSTTTPLLTPAPGNTLLAPGFKLDPHNHGSASPTMTPRDRGKAEQERFEAVQNITDRVAKLLRKTKLQVKVVIEVIHCKSPKHLITEVIDYINPTLVILGSRGRSALKGVILGSFSNYLVTKSSVPVMVARKRLRKHNKYKRPAMRLTNNIPNPAKSLHGIVLE